MEILELPNFGDKTKSAVWFNSSDQFSGDFMNRNCYFITFFGNIFVLRGLTAGNFAVIIKIGINVIRTTFEDSKKKLKELKELEITYENAIYIRNKSCWFSVKNDYISRTQGVRHIIYIFFWFSLGKV